MQSVGAALDRNRVVPAAWWRAAVRAMLGAGVPVICRGRLALLADARGGQPEAAAIDLIGHRALVKGLTDRCIQSLQ
jgi:hypothetical protein